MIFYMDPLWIRPGLSQRSKGAAKDRHANQLLLDKRYLRGI